MPDLDLLLRGGVVVDGTGNDPIRADLGVAGGRIVHVGDGQTSARSVLDCDDLIVGPGFVDIHSHADFTLLDAPVAETALAQGITTILTGNCGFSPFPVGADGPAALRRQAGFLADPMSWSWHDAAGFATELDAAHPAINIALQAGHHALRLAVVGADARPASRPEIDAMGALLDQAAAQGVFGFSTGLIYAPGRFAEPDEVLALVRVAARHGLLYSTHVRDETAHVVAAVTEAIDTAERAGARLEVSHLKAMGRAAHGSAPRLLELLDDARLRGVDVTADVYPFTASSTTLSSRLPAWALDGGADALVHRLADPSAHAAIAGELRARMPAEVDPDSIMLAGLPPGRYANAVGSTLTEVARREHRDAADTVLDVLREHQGTVSIVNHAMTDADLDAILRHPQVAVASDGSIMRAESPSGSGTLPHPRSFATASTVLGHYVRERRLLTTAEAVRKMTSLPAGRAGLTDRGVLRRGAVADIAVWDADRVAPRATYSAPWQLSAGMQHVVVGGVAAYRDGRATGDRPGRVLRRTAPSA